MKPKALRSKKSLKPSPKRLKHITATRRGGKRLTKLAETASHPEQGNEHQPRRAPAKDRLEKELESSPYCHKEIKRLKAELAKVTATQAGEKPKKLYFDEKALAERWSMSVQHIRKLRSVGVGPLVTYFGRSVRYRLRDVQQFEKANAFASRTAKEQSKAN